MAYLNYIIENEEVSNLTDKHQNSIATVINEATEDFIATNFQYVIENLEYFLQDVSGDILSLYEVIKNFAMYDYIHMIDAINEVSALDEDFENVYAVINEDVSDVFTGLGYGSQKAHQLLVSAYEEDDVSY